MLLIFHADFLATRKDLVPSVLFIPLSKRGRHVHLLNDVAPAHARVVSAEADLAFLRSVRNDALLGAPEVIVKQILEPHPRDEQEVPPVLTPLHNVVNRPIRTNLAIIL